MRRGCLRLRSIQILVFIGLLTPRLAAQDQPPAPEHPPEHQHMAMPPPDQGWSWMTDANVFVGYNYQQRLFADFAAVESQNWFMAAGTHKAGPGGRSSR